MSDQIRNMDERTWWDFWNTSYRADDNKDATSSELFDHVSAIINRLTREERGRVLEVACGTGALSRRLAFVSYHGLDISAAAIEIARQKTDLIQLPAGRKRPTYEPADFHEWPLPTEPFDVVVCVDAVSCFRDQAHVLRKIAQGLHPGGVVVLTTVNPFVYRRIRKVGGVKLENGPVSHWLSPNELHGLVKQAGLTLDRSYTIMPRGNAGILRLVNSPRLNHVLGARGAVVLRHLKEKIGLGQYRVVVARKNGRS